MVTETVRSALMVLYRIVDAGEKGFAVSAADMPDPDTKILLRTFARQRALFKEEIQAELFRGQARLNPGVNLPGMIHRGRVAIFSALTIEEDERKKTILKEAALGEKIALRTYEKTLQVRLPPAIREMVERQMAEVRKVGETISLLRNQNGKTLVLCHFDSEEIADLFILNFQSAGTPREAIDKVPLRDMDLYSGQGVSVLDTILAGFVGGAIWGGVIGVFAGFGLAYSMSADLVVPTIDYQIWFITTFGFLVLGSIVSGLLGLFVGMGISNEPMPACKDMIDPCLVMIQILVENTHAVAASQSLKLIRRTLIQSQPALKPAEK